ncbi:MAG: ribbon-helix-helix protein, CopG family [bacterium]|nr:ribbon-helix-helix protein, CopG family [bacterium]MCY3953323.1 ribbon-helix-helix protein, CopG family [bacterium]
MTQPRAKVSITIDEELLARVRLAVEAGHAKSVSAYIEHAVAGQLAAEDDFEAMLAESLAATGGPWSDEERAAARRILSGEAA